MRTFKQLTNVQIWETIGKHILAWAIYIAYELTYLFVVSKPNASVGSFILNYVLNISLFYFNALVLLGYFKGKLNLPWTIVAPLIVLEVAVFILIKYPINIFLIGPQVGIQGHEQWRIYIVANSLRSFYYIIFSSLYWLSILTVERTKKIAELEAQRLHQENERVILQKNLLQSRNAYLQAQINPHLLFNTLNFLYNATAKVSDKLAGAVMTLSDMMRYALTNIGEDDKVPLKDEVAHIDNFIRLNQVRYDESLNVNFTQSGDTGGLRIIPLALITLIENVFNYGDLLDSSYPATIELNVEDRELTLRIFNKKRLNMRRNGHGTGIANLKERLEIFYPKGYSILTEDAQQTYSLTLKLTLTD